MFNPIEASNNIKRSFVDYISTTFSIADQQYKCLFREELLKENTISKGPFLDIGGSFKSGKSLHELARNGQVSKLFCTLEDVPEKEKEIKWERPLYSHQEDALLCSKNGGNLVVTTGTGSGKTECFLLPILQSLLDELECGTLTRAVRAIIIYPMNALANDQMKRLRKILGTCPAITFGIYTGNTKHSQSQARPEYRSLNDGNDPLPNEIISREEMQANPPHILITNYSMLEYMMLRPKDDAVFSHAELRYVVLDEAHIYRGATGIETALLMRRLRARISSPDNVQYILTSATLGGKDANAEIVAFAESLCSAPFKADNIIRSIEINQPMIEYREFPAKLFEELYTEEHSIDEILASYNVDFAPNGEDEEKLFELLLRCKVFSELRKVADGAKTVSSIAKGLGITKEQLVHLVAVSAKAVKSGTSLIKARYHFLLRALEGTFITLSNNKTVYLTRREYDDAGNRIFEAAVCSDCGRIAVAGKSDDQWLVHPKQPHDNDAEYFLIKDKNDSEYFVNDDAEFEETDQNDYLLCPVCGAIELEGIAGQRNDLCEHSNSGYVRLRKANMRKSGKIACPACEFGDFGRFYIGYEAATAVIGTALYEQLPEYESIPTKKTKNDVSDFFGISTTNEPQQVKRARQFLAFSDSRADAAFFASYMEQSYQEFLRRRGLWQICEKMIAEDRDTITTTEAINALARLLESEGSFVKIGKENESQTDICRTEACIAVINELYSSKRPSGLVQLGKMQFVYDPKCPAKKDKWEKAIQVIADNFDLPHENIKRDAEALLNLIMLDVVYNGALDGGDDFTLTADEREYLFYGAVPKKVIKTKISAKGGGKSHQTGWIPRQRTGETKSYYLSTRMSRVMRAMGWEAEEAWVMLEELWKSILDFQDNTEYSLPIQDFTIKLYDTKLSSNSLKIYSCDKCGRVTIHNCQDKCVNLKCSGMLNEFNPVAISSGHHYVSLYSAKNMKPLYIKEHTAQLSRDRAAEYQKLFVQKKLNALSSSTTFEMGVDVGSLETVFLRNIPPSPANYVQRAGRAGRSLHSAAYAVTYAKLSSHDFTYFKNPEGMINGNIKAPRFELENKKIIRRHINAVAISAFFKRHDEVYDGDNRSELLNSDGYEKLKTFLSAKPPDLRDLLEKSIPRSKEYGVEDWSWINELIGDDGILKEAVMEFRETCKFLEADLERCRNENNDHAAAAAKTKLRNFRADKIEDGRESRKSLIDFLVRNNILPKYGFPVDTVELLPEYISARDGNRPQLQRDLQQAVAEYAPGSEIAADGMLYTSRYIQKSPNKSISHWEFGWYSQCPNNACGEKNYYRDTAIRDDFSCLACGETIPKIDWKKTLEPRRGFIAGNSDLDKPKPVKMRKPEKHYKTDDFYIGDLNKRILDKRTFVINNNTIQIESTANDSLVVRTQTPFEICMMCGYATGDAEAYRTSHKNPLGKNCINDSAGVEHFLTHEFKTDVARITFEVDSATNFECMLSVLFAFLESMSKELNIERNDIKGCLYRTKLENGVMVYNLIIYDAVAGGAGHSRRLVTSNGETFSSIINRAASMMDSCDCEPSCYKCLRNYYNQKLHEYLNRVTAKDFLLNFCGDITPVAIVS